MIAKTRAIILKNTNYSDNSIISKMYTRQFGLRTYIFQSIRKGKSAVRPSMIQPLSLVQMDVYEKANSNIQRVKELKNEPMLLSIQDSIAKKSVAMFMIEMLNLCITEEQCDEHLFDFLEEYILKLESNSVGSVFPTLFLLELTKFLGVEPQGKFSATQPYFSLEQGVFTYIEETDSLTIQLSELLSLLMERKTVDYNKVARTTKASLLNAMVRYYQYHLIKGKKVKSIGILSELLA